MAENQASNQPAKKPKLDEEYEPSEEGRSGSDSVELLSDELNENEQEIDLDDYLRNRQRIIEEEQAEAQASQRSEESEDSQRSEDSQSSEGSDQDSSSSEEEKKAPVRRKRPRSISSSSD